jgi:hypothetical protein
MKFWFKNLLLNRVYLNSVKRPLAKKRIKYGAKIKSISVILDHQLGIEKECFKKMAELFNLSDKNIRVLTYYRSPNKIDKETFNSSYSFEDITNFGKINSVLNEFCTKKSDILINYYDRNDINLKYISVGFAGVDHELNDLIIDIDAKNIGLFTDECFKYLKTIFR